MRKVGFIFALAGFLGLYLFLARSYALCSAITYDETLHLASAYVIRHHSDYRVNPEDPPLIQHLASLALPAGSLAPDLSHPDWPRLLSDTSAHWQFANRALFSDPSVRSAHADTLARARLMMLIPAGLLGVVALLLTHTLTRQLAPTLLVPTLLLTGLFLTFEPNLLGHASLVKNDVPLALFFTLAVWAMTRLMSRVTLSGVLLLGMAIGGACATKFSGLLLLPLFALTLFLRCLLPHSWHLYRRPLSSRFARATTGFCIVTTCLLVTWGMLWAAYGFRHLPSSDPAVRFDLGHDLQLAQNAQSYRHLLDQGYPFQNSIQQLPPPSSVIPMSMRLMTGLAEAHLIPQTYAKGFNYTYASTIVRWSYLLGELYYGGRWVYFPLCLAFKLPLALVACGVLCCVAYMRPSVLRVLSGVAPIILPSCVIGLGYFVIAVTGELNLGIRHLLPIFPLGFSLLGLGVARLFSVARLPARVLLAGLLVALPMESLASRDRYIAFFNLPSRLYGPHRLLGDSNLDWGQSLTLLADWQRRHPDTALSLVYFGSATPDAYLPTAYTPLFGTLYSDAAPTTNNPPYSLTRPGVVAVSATHLQEIYADIERHGPWSRYRRFKPREVLGGSIFLFDWPPRSEDLEPDPMPLTIRLGTSRHVIPLPTK